VDDFARRSGLSRAVIKRLAAADAFASLTLDRRTALWQALGQEEPGDHLPLLAQLADEPEPAAPLPAMPIRQQVLADYQTAGLSLHAHPLQFERQALEKLRVVPAARLPMQRDGGSVRVAGLVLVRQRPATAKGITFVTLEDETGTVNLIIRQDVWQRFYRVARTATLLLAQGRLQRKGQIIHVLVARLEDLSELLGGMGSQSRDFH
jgi:error-prone DNA polymerase